MNCPKKEIKYLFLIVLLLVFDYTAISQKVYENDCLIKHYTNENGLPSNLINDVNSDKNGFVWIATQSGLSRYNGRSFYNYSSINFPSIKNNRFDKIQRRENGELIIKTSDNQFFKVNKNSELIYDSSLVFGKNCIVNGSYELIFKDENPVLFSTIKNFEGVNNGNFYYNLDSSSWYHVNINQIVFGKDKKVPNINHLFFSNAGFVFNKRLAMLSYTKKLYVIFKDKIEAVYDLENLLNRKIDISSLIFNKNNNEIDLHVGSDLFKVMILDNKLKFKQINKYGIEDKSLKRSIYLKNEKVTIFYSGKNGLYFLQPSLFKNELKPLLGEEKAEVYRVFVNSLGMPFSFNSSIFKNFKFVNKFSTAININSTEICMLNNDSVYYITNNSFENYKIDILSDVKDKFYTDAFISKGKKYVLLRNELLCLKGKYKLENILKVNFTISSAYEFYIPNHWLLVRDKDGMELYNTLTKKGKIFSELKGKEVRFVKYDSSINKYWVFTYGTGIYWMDKDLKISKFFNDPNAVLNFSHYYLKDKKGNYWIPTNNGLVLIEKSEVWGFVKNPKNDLQMYKFDTNNGLIDKEFNGRFYNSGVKLSDGRFAMSNMSGIVEFNPDSYIPYKNNNPIIVENVEYNGDKKALSNQYFVKEGFADFTIKLALADIDLINHTNIEYNIPEISDKWIPLNNLKLNLYSLKRGTYNVCFRKNKDLEVINHKKIKLIVKPAWYSSNIAIIIYGLILVVFTISISKYYFRLKQRKIKGELVLLENELKALREQINPHYLSNSLVSLQNMLLDDDQEKVFNILGNYGKIMRKMLEKSDDTYISLQTELDTITEYVYLESQVHKKEISMNINLDKITVSANDIKIPVFLLQPIIENALIHGLFPKKEGERILEINCTLLQEYIKIEIIDNGVGFNPSYATHRKSYGMENIRKRLNLLEKMHQLELDFSIQNISNNQKTGTHVTINLPIKKS
jgi:anti-sigma regulatory factor (Ser/Thr protein kinase)